MITKRDSKGRILSTCPHRAEAFSTRTMESEYWAGLLMADGCIIDTYPDSPPSVQLCLKDREHVESFRQFMGSTATIRQLHGSWSIQIYSRQVVRDLAAFGILPRKSRTAEVIDLAGSRDFWRGVIDGDGNIRPISGGRSRRNYPNVRLSCGSRRIVEQFFQYVISLAPFNESTVHEERTRPGIYTLSVSGRAAAKLLIILYKDSVIALKRKYNAAECLTGGFANYFTWGLGSL